MKRNILFSCLVGSLFVYLLAPVVANAQPVTADMGRVASMAAAAQEMASAQSKEMESLKQRLAELDKLFAFYGESPASVLRFITEVRGWEKQLPPKIRAQVKGFVDRAVAAALKKETDKLREEFAALKTELTKEVETLKTRLSALEARVETVEKAVVETKADVADLKERVGVNLAPELLVVANHKVAAFNVGARLLIPAATSGWEVGLEGVVGVTHARDLSWGAGVDVTKKLKPWVSLGPAINVDSLDIPAKPGVTEITATGGLRTDFHVGPVDITVGGGIGLGYDGDPAFDWNVRAGASYRCL